MSTIGRSRSLTQLESDDWGPPNFPSSLVERIHRLRYLPLERFGAGELRVCIGQKMSLSILVPLALERLEEDPFLEGDFYEGDLLAAVLRVEEAHWIANPKQAARAEAIARAAADDPRVEGDVEMRANINAFVLARSPAG